jgi:hypothetical protein
VRAAGHSSRKWVPQGSDRRPAHASGKVGRGHGFGPSLHR